MYIIYCVNFTVMSTFFFFLALIIIVLYSKGYKRNTFIHIILLLFCNVLLIKNCFVLKRFHREKNNSKSIILFQ